MLEGALNKVGAGILGMGVHMLTNMSHLPACLYRRSGDETTRYTRKDRSCGTEYGQDSMCTRQVVPEYTLKSVPLASNTHFARDWRLID
jgi:hypothetical protein